SFHLRFSDLKGAEAYLRKLLDPKTGSAADDLRWARRGLALRLAQSGDYPQFLEARRLMDETAQEGSETLEDQRTRALVLASHPHFRREALTLLESVFGKQPPTPEEELLLGDLYEKVRQWPQARQIYNLLANGSDKPAH